MLRLREGISTEDRGSHGPARTCLGGAAQVRAGLLQAERLAPTDRGHTSSIPCWLPSHARTLPALGQALKEQIHHNMTLP